VTEPDRFYAPFHGDGRRKDVRPLVGLPAIKPLRVSNAQARMMIDSFVKSGQSSHSGQGGTLWVILLWCQYNRVGYKLRARPNEFYLVELDKESS
jgi:hypothetical protein